MSEHTPEECGNSPAEVRARIDAAKAFFESRLSSVGSNINPSKAEAILSKRNTEQPTPFTMYGDVKMFNAVPTTQELVEALWDWTEESVSGQEESVKAEIQPKEDLATIQARIDKYEQTHAPKPQVNFVAQSHENDYGPPSIGDHHDAPVHNVSHLSVDHLNKPAIHLAESPSKPPKILTNIAWEPYIVNEKWQAQLLSQDIGWNYYINNGIRKAPTYVHNIGANNDLNGGISSIHDGISSRDNVTIIHPHSHHGNIQTINGGTTIIWEGAHISGSVINDWGRVNIWGIEY